MDEMFSLHDVLLIAIATIVGGGAILIVWIWMNRNSSSNNTASGDGDLSSKPRPSCIPPPGQDYEVFLSFRGEDTRKEFTDHLYNRLNDAGIWVFRDNEGLHVGEKIDPELMKAIQASKISIPIISPNYASSKWCLRELVQILECKKAGQIVLPIFYKVTPSDVRNQTGDFGKAFLMHQKKCSTNDIQEWRNTLKEVASLKGLESNKIADGHEGELVKTVLRKVLKKLKKANLVVDDHLIGVQEHVEKIIEMVHTKASNEVQVILIHGMGGIGKTTLAKLIYNQFSIDYDHRSFLPDIRERSSHDRGRVELQKQLISDILEQTSTEGVTNIDAGINIIKDRVKEKKVLILLDDVSHIDQLKALAEDRDWFKSGSLLIITSRNKDILKKWDKKLTYELNGLDPEQSFQLFRYHAFGRDNARQSELEHIAGEIVSTTGGLPLAIKVIGSLLFGEFKDIWEDTLKRLQETPDDEVMGKLRISYDSLKYEEQQIFLDIACFSFQYVENFAYYMWDSCRFHPHLHVKNLISLSLIKIEDNNRLVIHDQLRDLGMSIVRQESFYDLGKRSRLWVDEDAWGVLNEKQGTKKIEAISLECYDKSEVYSLTSEHFKDLTKLRFLYLEDISLNGDFDNLLPNLRWLRWVEYSCTPMETMPINFHPRKLAVLDLENIPITEHWSGWNQVEVVKKLKVVRLVGCKKLTTTPDFSSFKELEILIIRHCVNLIGIHPSICNIKKTLMTLEVSNCGKLEELPIEVGELEKLKNFTLYETSIREIPESIGSLVELHTLKLRSSYSLTKIPKSIGKLGSLSKLHLYLKRTEVPGSIGNLHNLEELCISNFPSLEKIIDLSGLKKLTKLELCGCGAESMGHLTSLEELLIRNCKSLQMINDLSHLKKLTRFHLRSCNELIEVEGIGRLMSLKELSIENCKSLEAINELSFLKKLEKLRLSDCDKLIGVQGIGKLTSLERLFIKNCKSLETINDLSHLKKLEELELSGCDKLIGVKGIGQLTSLKRFYFMDCPLFERFFELFQLTKLEALELKGIGRITFLKRFGFRKQQSFLYWFLERQLIDIDMVRGLKGISQLISLEMLYIEDCPYLESIGELSHLKKLRKLQLKQCYRLSGVDCIGQLTYLEELFIKDCPLLEIVSDLSHLKKLKELKLVNCEMLSGIEAIGQSTSLGTLIIADCPLLERINNLSELKKLRRLYLSNCEMLSGVESIGQVTSLISLELRSIPQLKIIGDLFQLKKLIQLELDNCKKLSTVEGIGQLTYLEILQVYDLPCLKTIGDLFQLKNLRELRLVNCEKLSGVEGIDQLTSLENLTLIRLPCLKTIGDLSQLKKLEEITLSNREMLTGIKGISNAQVSISVVEEE